MNTKTYEITYRDFATKSTDTQRVNAATQAAAQQYFERIVPASAAKVISVRTV